MVKLAKRWSMEPNCRLPLKQGLLGWEHKKYWSCRRLPGYRAWAALSIRQQNKEASYYKGRKADWTLIGKVKNESPYAHGLREWRYWYVRQKTGHKNRYGWWDQSARARHRLSMDIPWDPALRKYTTILPHTGRTHSGMPQTPWNRLNGKARLIGINEMRRHYTNYLKGLPGIKEFGYKLVTLNSLWSWNGECWKAFALCRLLNFSEISQLPNRIILNYHPILLCSQLKFSERVYGNYKWFCMNFSW